MRKFIFILVGLFVPVIVSGTELLMIHENGCEWCEVWEEEVGYVYPKTPEGKFAPLKRVEIDDIWKIGKFDPGVVYTPTFLLISDSKEIGRIEGYPGEDFFWALLNQILYKKTEYKENLRH